MLLQLVHVEKITWADPQWAQKGVFPPTFAHAIQCISPAVSFTTNVSAAFFADSSEFLSCSRAG